MFLLTESKYHVITNTIIIQIANSLIKLAISRYSLTYFSEWQTDTLVIPRLAVA